MNHFYSKSIVLTIVLLSICGIFANATIPPHYYDNALGLKKDKLKAALHNIIGKANVLEYGSGSGYTWEGFYKVDRKSDNSVIDRYSKDVRYFSKENSAVSGMNIEHSMAKSWWGGGKNQAYKDIHHLMPCESGINSSKSNYPMGVVNNDKSGNGYTKVGTGDGGSGSLSLWEPADEWKGDFARVYFYMATCYSNLTWEGVGLKQMENNEWPTLQKWTYELLLKWNAEDPVNDLERTRNEGVYAIQGNRNPFIDYPNLAEYIWGSKMNEPWNTEGAITPTDPGDDSGTNPQPFDGTIYSETFGSSLGDCTTDKILETGANAWATNANYSCAIANAYTQGKIADQYLITPMIDLTDFKSAILSFEHATGFNGDNNASDMFTVEVTTDVQDIERMGASIAYWDILTVPNWPEKVSSGYTKFENSGNIDLTKYCGKQIHIGFHYKSNENACWAWEIKNMKVTGEKTDAAKIFDVFNQVATNPNQQVYTVNGVLLGNEIPSTSGIYIVKTKNKTVKIKR